MKPEEKAEIILWDWLKTKGVNIQEIYFNRVNKLNAPIFITQGINKKPDFLIKIDDGYGIKYYALEIKSSDNSKNILRASKILDKYLIHYLKGETTYFINDKKIKLRGFLIASEQSPNGYLFKNETWIDNTIKEGGLSKYNVATKYKIIPKREGTRSFEFIRYLWEEYSKFRNKFIEKLDVGIILGNTEDNFFPYIFISNFYTKKEKWTQRWWKI